ncbi:MAG: MFS transporter, partial [Venatoribacter sp.]
MFPLTVWGLALGQALLTTGNILLVTVTALIGQELAPSMAMVTLPVTLQFLGLMSATLPAALFMEALGRKLGFLVGNIIGVVGAFLALWALQEHSFMWFCLSTTLLGIAIGVGQQYRFAAVEVCASHQHAKAISIVMAGGILAAFLGPNLAVWAKDMFPESMFLGPFTVLAGLYIFTMLLILSLPLPKVQAQAAKSNKTPYLTLLKRPSLISAIAAGSIGYGVMVLVMTATPLAMKAQGFEFAAIAKVIQWHVLGMFLPSFFTGSLINRFGSRTIILVGGSLLVACNLLAQFGFDFWLFLLALMLLGVGWNFTFIGATALLTKVYAPQEKAQVQGVNDMLVFGFSALGSLFAGALELNLGWQVLNLLMLPF